MSDLELPAASTAVVLIDLQYAVTGRQTAPRAPTEVIETSAALADRFRQKGSPVVYVRVDLANFRKLTVDQPSWDPNAPPPPPNASEIVPEAGRQPGDLLITKPYWDAFIGTDLADQLQQRKVRTILLGGIATNFGVESTARTAAAHGFDVIVVEDATASMTLDLHQFSFKYIFPRLGRVRTASQLRPA